jgi:cyanophycin synthetase
MRIRVLERLALMGPNLYSHRPAIKWKIDLGELEEQPTNKIPHFAERLKELMPSLVEHRCSEGVRGGFFSRVDDGTWLGHVMEHVALGLQELVGSNVGFGRTRGTGETGIYNVVYECEERETGIEAGEIALDLIHALIEQQPFALEERVRHLLRTHEHAGLGPSTRSIVEAAVKRGIPYLRLDDMNLVQLGYGANARRIQATIASTTRHLGVEIAGDKDLTKNLLGFHGVPVPKGDTCRTWEGALEIAGEIGWPVVVKPLDASQGRGIVTNVRDERELKIAFEAAKQHRATIIVERYVTGSDFRLLVINHRFVAAAMRVPAHVVGDGEQTIAQLVEKENQDPRRGESHEKVMTKIKIDTSTRELLELRGLTLDSVPEKGQVVYLKTTANLSTGGTAIDVTDCVAPANIELAERISCLVDLNIAGIDVVAPSIDVPLTENGGAIVEVNAAPGFRMHLAPTSGKPRPVGEAVVDMLFPPGAESRIPIITITGTNGKTTTARLCAHIARQAGYCVGLTTSDGIYIKNQLIQKGDTTGPQSAAVVLRDPSVNFAVLETARGGILRAGVAYDWSNVAVVTNIAEDHLGLRDIHTLEDLAHVKAVTVERVFDDGYAVLNAEDDMTPVIRERADCKIAFFALHSENPAFRWHVQQGGLGATVENGQVVLYDKGRRSPLCEAARIPLTFGGKADFHIANSLAAVIATYASRKIPVSQIVSGLMTFYPTPEQTPGRTNVISIDGFDVMLDYGHNPHGIAAVSALAAKIRRRRLIAILGLPGDRRNEDIAACAKVVAQTFDLCVTREDFDRRGRAEGEVPQLIMRTLREHGMRDEQILEGGEEEEAVNVALSLAERDDLVVYFADKPETAAKFIDGFRERRRAEKTAAAS